MQRTELVATWCNTLIFIYLSPIFSFHEPKNEKNIPIKIYSKGEREKKDYKLGSLHYIASHITC